MGVLSKPQARNMLTRITWVLVLLWKSEQIMPYSNLKQPNLTALDRKACTIYRGHYIVAGNNAEQSTSKANLQECANWCAEIPACQAWTFKSDELRCWLKLSDGEKGCPDGDCEAGPWVSGTKSCGANTGWARLGCLLDCMQCEDDIVCY